MRLALRLVSTGVVPIAMFLLLASPATATVIGWRFEGVVTDVLDHGNSIGSAFQIGDTFDGHLAYDTDTPVEVVQDGFYRYNDPAPPGAPGLSVGINGLSYESNSNWINLTHTGVFTTQSDDVWTDGPVAWAIELYFRDLDSGVGSALPTTLDLAEFELASFYWAFFDGAPGFVEGQVTKLVPNPEPGSGLLLAAGLLAVALARRR